MTFRPAVVLVTALIALSSARIAVAAEACPPGRNPPVAAAALKKRLDAKSEGLIVALGSSSTEGWMSTAASRTYPAQLQEDLSAALPLAHIAVINRGIGGQDAPEELARLEADVVDLRPDMVIWQVGANGAMGHADPVVFKKLVTAGVERLKARGIDVVLMDNQRSPMVLASPVHALMEQALADLSVQLNVSLFSRGTLMDGWKRNGYDYAQFLAGDNVHMNDLGYRCTAEALAAAIEQGLGEPASRIAVAHAVN